MQFWTDYRIVAGYRLQRNELTHHWRVLDPKNIRLAWGVFDDCAAAWQSAVATNAPDVTYRRVIILLHGLMRTPRSMTSLSVAIQKEIDGHIVIPTYASTRTSIANHAAAMRSVIEWLPGRPTIDFVAHSLGNIVIRHALADWKRDDPSNIYKLLHRMVMLGPPNQGAMIAKRLARLGLFELITGQSGLELGRDWNTLVKRLAIPEFPFAIVAGIIATMGGRHPLIEGDSDLVVGGEETHLNGATQEIQVPYVHSVLMDAVPVQRFVIDFLEEREDSSTMPKA
jgi:hypothetical protein